MAFTTKAVEVTPTFGDKLKKLREEAGLSKQKVAQLLNIQIKYLERLEAGEIEKMPAGVYAKGFLQKYAKLLNTDANTLLADYEKEVKIVSHLNGKVHKSLPRLRFRRFTITPKFITLLVIVAVFIVVGGYLFYQLSFLVSPPKLIISEPADNLITDKKIITIKGQTEPGVKLTVNGQQIYTDTTGNFEKEINVEPGLNTIIIQAQNRFEKKSEEIRNVLVR